MEDGKIKRDFNLFLLGAGTFFSVLATGYVPMALQLVGTNVFGFQPAESGFMLVSPFLSIRNQIRSSDCSDSSLTFAFVVPHPPSQSSLPLPLLPPNNNPRPSKNLLPLNPLSLHSRHRRTPK